MEEEQIGNRHKQGATVMPLVWTRCGMLYVLRRARQPAGGSVGRAVYRFHEDHLQTTSDGSSSDLRVLTAGLLEILVLQSLDIKFDVT